MTTAEPKGKTILLVDDDAGTRLNLAAVLRTDGYTVLEAPDGPSAEALLAKTGATPALLLTDFVMPGMDGHQLANRIRAKIPGIKVLIMSAHIENESVQKGVLEEGFRAGALFLQKPFEPDALLRRVRALLSIP
jgi:two-component system cell cycle sensor histidine kinase/response regulator CckA